VDKTGKYVDGSVAPVSKNSIEAYKQFSEKVGRVWKEYGALEYIECIADDVKPGKVTSFPQAVQLKDDEVVVFAWIVYESREHRDRRHGLGHERSTPERHGSEINAVRRNAYVLRRVQRAARHVSGATQKMRQP
jgi:uncharacterized protein YbaA (DUF1428 family)